MKIQIRSRYYLWFIYGTESTFKKWLFSTYDYPWAKESKMKVFQFTILGFQLGWQIT